MLRFLTPLSLSFLSFFFLDNVIFLYATKVIVPAFLSGSLNSTFCFFVLFSLHEVLIPSSPLFLAHCALYSWVRTYPCFYTNRLVCFGFTFFFHSTSITTLLIYYIYSPSFDFLRGLCHFLSFSRPLLSYTRISLPNILVRFSTKKSGWAGGSSTFYFQRATKILYFRKYFFFFTIFHTIFYLLVLLFLVNC